MLNFASDDIPNPIIARLSPEQEEFLNAKNERAINSRQEMDSAIGAALAQSENAFAPRDVRMSGALTSRYRHALANAMQNVRANTATRGFEASSRALASATQAQRLRTQMAIQNLERIQDAQRQREAARARVLGSIFGIGGMIGGAIVGGPKGAMVGGSIGRSVGKNAAGGPQGSSGASSGGGDPYGYRPGMSGAQTQFQTDPSLY